MSLESILFARLVVGDDGGDLEQPQSYKKEVSKRKEKMYTQTGYFAGWVHHRPCWRHSRKPVLSFFFRVLQTFWFFKREEITANSYNIFGCLFFFGTPLSLSFFLSFFLLCNTLRVPPGEWFITGGGGTRETLDVLFDSSSPLRGRQSYVNQSGNKPP